MVETISNKYQDVFLITVIEPVLVQLRLLRFFTEKEVIFTFLRSSIKMTHFDLKPFPKKKDKTDRN